MEKEGAEKEKKQDRKFCWWNGNRCSLNPRGGGLKEANLAWCIKCEEPDAELLMEIAVVILGKRSTAKNLFFYERTPENELPRLVCLAWREEG